MGIFEKRRCLRAEIKLPDDTVLDINIIEADYGYYDIEFQEAEHLNPTGGGDEFRFLQL